MIGKPEKTSISKP